MDILRPIITCVKKAKHVNMKYECADNTPAAGYLSFGASNLRVVQAQTQGPTRIVAHNASITHSYHNVYKYV